MTKTFLHLEGLAVFISALIIYGMTGYSWWIFVVFLFTPDISMLGYLRNEKIGAYVYNVSHTYTASFLIFGMGYFMSKDFVIAIGIIWTAHIGMDRMLGFGLKHTEDFKSTHLNKI